MPRRRKPVERERALTWESISKAERVELVNLYHLRAAGDNPYQRRLYAAKMFAREHPQWTATQAYKALDYELS